MSSATFDINTSLVEASDVQDPLLAYTYSSNVNNWDESSAKDEVHYLAIPVNALNTRSVTIQVFYDQTSGDQQKPGDEEKRTADSKDTGNKKNQTFDPFINQTNDTEPFEPMNGSHFNTDNDPMLLDSQLNGNYLMSEEKEDETDGFMNAKDMIEDKNDSIFFEDAILGDSTTEDYGSMDTYQNAFTVACTDVKEQQTNEEFRILKRFRNSTNSDNTREMEYVDKIDDLNSPPTATSPAKVFRCTYNQCDKVFASERALKYHSITHSPAIYACSKCFKAFGSMIKLKRHSMIHDSVRPFGCDHPGCDKSFTTKSNLNVHKRVHTGEKPYVCSVCSRAFSHQSHAKAHLKIHIKKFQNNVPAESE